MLKLDAAKVEEVLNDPAVSDEDKRWLREQLVIYEASLEANPLQAFWPHSVPQRQFMEAKTRLQAALAGNRFGKTTALVVKCLIQHTPDDILPDHLKPYKLATGSPVMGRLLVPSEKAFITYTEPAIKKWIPKQLYRGGNWAKAWSKQHSILYFADGGQLGVYTYSAEAETMVGADLDYVGYDEPPPEAHRNECRIRLVDRDGFEMFAFTPVNTGAGIGWLYRTVWKRREHPDVTVVRGAIHDNPLLSKAAVEAALAEYPDDEREAREFGTFKHFGGMVYPDGFEKVLVPPVEPKQLEGQDIVVGIDPGLKNAAFVWVAFDRDNRAVVFDTVMLQEQTPAAYVKAIRAKNIQWGLKNPLYVIDPSARNRSLTNADSVESLLQKLGVYPMHGQNDVQAGVQQIRDRIAQEAFFVCRQPTTYPELGDGTAGVRDEAEEYRMQDRPDGEFKVVKENDHRLDALRYALMARLWFRRQAADPLKGPEFEPGVAPPMREFFAYAPAASVPPMGSMS